MKLADVSLDDRYDLSRSQLLLNGTQAIVRLSMMQHERDRRAGLSTAGYVSGYRGSPLGGLDQQFLRAGRWLDRHDIRFQPGLNEDLAATALWGTQQAELYGEGAYDGVFGIWYGKGPGVDRSSDVLRHANHAGTSPHGGVLALMGDDHVAESSTLAHQSEFVLVDVMMPILNPAGVQELLDYGLLGWALSRYCGCWVGLKCVKDTIESTAVVDASLDRIEIATPTDYERPPGGLNIRLSDQRLEQEERLHNHKRYAATAFARANGIDRMILRGGRAPKLGVIATGKSYLDVRQALDELGIDEVKAARLGLRLYKVGMPWPLEPEGIERFAKGLETILVVEEKRSLIETQVREQLYGRANAPLILGKRDERGRTLFAPFGALSPNEIAIAIAECLSRFAGDAGVGRALKRLKTVEAGVRRDDGETRIPYFCAGCPHNSSTVVPEQGRAYAGIGCHWMAQFMDRNTQGNTHMGGEGANWIGEAPFSTRAHVFQNLGDGTYDHSGILAIRAAVAAGVNITYKILYNDAVAMTGGQPLEGGLTVPMIARQVAAEGVGRVAVVTDEPDKYPRDVGFPPGTAVHHRDNLQQVQRELMETEGVTALIYDQTCAAEKRRRRKRGLYPDPPRRVFINELVCEGCGDCGVQSNCVAIVPSDTEFGRKRQIDQSACNKDYSCLKGFCPSFVTVEGGSLIKGAAAAAAQTPDAAVFEVLPEPKRPALERPYSILVAGIGGTGVVTIAALLAMAARLEGKGAGVIDMAGLAQKNGAVASHVKIATRPDDIRSIRVAAGGADLVLGCDVMVTGARDVLNTMSRDRSRVVVNTHETMPATFTRDADYRFPSGRLSRAIQERVGKSRVEAVDAMRLATALMGDSIATNLFMLGLAYQKGLVPLSAEAIGRAIEINGVAVEMNTQAFLWGRRAAHDRARVEKIAGPARQTGGTGAGRGTLEEIVARRAEFLTGYQDAAYAARYETLVEKVRTAERDRAPGKSGLAEAVARYYFKLLACKDEYEVARLYTDGRFARALAQRFEGDYKLRFHLAPPLLARRDPATGRARKSAFGPWMMGLFRLLAGLKGLRGTPFDIFAYSAERRRERRLVAEYEAVVEEILAGLGPDNHKIAVELAATPEHIRGFGHVKQSHLETAKAREAELLAAFRQPKKARIPEVA